MAEVLSRPCFSYNLRLVRMDDLAASHIASGVKPRTSRDSACEFWDVLCPGFAPNPFSFFFWFLFFLLVLGFFFLVLFWSVLRPRRRRCLLLLRLHA